MGEIEIFKLYENNNISIEKVVDIFEIKLVVLEDFVVKLDKELSNYVENIFYNNESVLNELY